MMFGVNSTLVFLWNFGEVLLFGYGLCVCDVLAVECFSCSVRNL